MWIALALDELWKREAQLEGKISDEDAIRDYIATHQAEAELDVLLDVILMQIEDIRQGES
ncbi:hypothetical protein [Vulcanococcus sp. Clear-D1]|uniref:hypothetical protein n=1 Tax=Vulcanococcus sp. Clear-D1 TaxID=2766970 RepID=UPI0019AC158E|nr:hypothetical protein [Vulcanococcus sp. Clear-D1]MBD1194319.1 hypothetical protein [Vulcanococcus sp. Clear-D1]